MTALDIMKPFTVRKPQTLVVKQFCLFSATTLNHVLKTDQGLGLGGKKATSTRQSIEFMKTNTERNIFEGSGQSLSRVSASPSTY